VVDLGCERGERTPWAQTVRTCRQLVQRKEALWTFLEKPGIEFTNKAADRALRQSVIHRKISQGIQSASGAIYRSRLLTVSATLQQQGRDLWSFLELAWIAHLLGGVMPLLVADR
jgi:transposase